MNAVIRSGTTASGQAFRIKRVDHTGFTVSSLETSLAFWVDVLGFRHLYTWAFETTPFIEELVGVPGAALPGSRLSSSSFLRTRRSRRLSTVSCRPT